jgi:hypothetical protein
MHPVLRVRVLTVWLAAVMLAKPPRCLWWSFCVASCAINQRACSMSAAAGIWLRRGPTLQARAGSTAREIPSNRAKLWTKVPLTSRVVWFSKKIPEVECRAWSKQRKQRKAVRVSHKWCRLSCWWWNASFRQFNVAKCDQIQDLDTASK